MHRNDKIKHAVAAAISMMTLGFQSSSYALGLSEIAVESNLGEALKAQVTILGANDLKDTACLRLGQNSDISHVNFSVGAVKGNIAKLSLTTNKIINEPILNLSVIAGCDSSIRRDYVLLLDPPSYNQPLISEATTFEAPVIVGKIDTSVNTSTKSTASKATSNAVSVMSSIKKPKKKVVANKKTKVVAKKSKGILQETIETSTPVEPTSTQPRLSISGASYSSNAVSSTGLRLDKQLRFTPKSSPVITSDSIAIEDEVTVMNKRLAHLQKQINALQEQNLKLQSENKLKSEQLMQAGAFSLGSVLPLIGTGILIFGGIVAYQWYRRREALLQTHSTEAIWVNTNNDEASLNEENKTEGVSLKRSDKEALLNDVDFDIDDSDEEDTLIPNTMESAFESTRPQEDTFVIDEDESFSVLDHADVFLSHGRATLAIQLLQNHLLEFPRQSVTIWLFLLDLLAKENLQKLYEQTAEECKLLFNVKIPEFSKTESNSNESLEDFPRLAQGLVSVWNTPEALSFLDDLIYNNRLEPRAGLAKNLIEELVLLRSMVQDRVNSAEVIQLDEKKIAINEQKEALLEAKKADKLKEIAEAERIAKEKAELEKNETDFEFTLVEKY